MIKKLRRIFIVFLVVDLCVAGYLGFRLVETSVPDRLFAFVGSVEDIPLPLFFNTKEDKARETFQVTNKDSGFSILSEKVGDYRVPVSLFGIWPIKDVDVHVIEETKVAPSGEPIGIYVETNGLLVLDTAEIEGEDGLTYEPGGNVVKSGDYILKWNNRSVATITQLTAAIQTTGKKKVKVTIRRGKEKLEVAMRPILATDKKYKIGVWVREDTQGIGTLTYVTENGTFGTLGHGITDADTGTLLNLQEGELYRTKILGIEKGEDGEPGELHGYINMVAANEIGDIEKNTKLGVFGKMKQESISEYSSNYMPVGMKQDIKKGKAWIYANLEGRVKKYEIKIENIKINSTDNKSMIIKITDKDLLSLTGGIVQGMSGSPIIQNNKVIGAVTHVLVDDPTRGYGVFIENMLAE
ncbi:MAG: SpoIVB peptidase [Lachnospiraceae bacterium]|nr:SpoIVB peptidase [Lachnospiraceae bacterium]